MVNLLDGLFHWWDFTSPSDISDKATDRTSGIDIDFSEVGTLATALDAPHGGGWIDFTSSGSNYLSVGGIASNSSAWGFEHTQNDMTFATVFSLDSIAGSINWELFSWRGGAVGTLNFHAFIDNPNGDLIFRCWDDAGTLLELEEPGLSIDTVYGLVVTIDESTGDGKMYLNNTLVAEATQILGIPDPNNRTMRIGQKSWATNGNFFGKIGPTGVWGRVLDAADRMWLSNGNSWRLYSELGPVNTNRIVHDPAALRPVTIGSS